MKLKRNSNTVMECPVGSDLVAVRFDTVELSINDLNGLIPASDKQLRLWVERLTARATPFNER